MRLTRRSVLLAPGVAFALATVGTPAFAAANPKADASRKLKLLSRRIGYSWWTNPLAHRSATTGNFYFVGVTETGEQRVYRRDPNGKVNYTIVGKVAADDHNSPSLSVEHGYPSLVFTSGHTDWAYVRRTSRMQQIKTGQASPFSARRKLPFTARTSYTQVLRQGNRVIVLARTSKPWEWRYVRSTDSGATWSAEKVLMTAPSQAYLWVEESWPGSGRFNIVCYSHPRSGASNAIRFGQATFEQLWTGKLNGSTVTNLGELVVTATQSYPDQAAGSAPMIRLLDVVAKRDHSVALAYATWNDGDSAATYRMAIRKPDQPNWTHHKLGSAAGFQSGAENAEAMYVPGVRFDRRPGSWKLYWGSGSGTSWQLRSTGFSSSGLGATTTLASDTRPLIRPVDVGSRLMFLRADRYLTYTDYRFSAYDLSTS